MMELPLEIDVTTAAERLAAPPAGRPLLLDCRTPEEYATARIAGAVLVPMQEIVARVAELEPHRGQPVIVHCHHGMRSLRVTKWLREQGFSQAQSMAGGIDAWSEQVDPTVPRY